MTKPRSGHRYVSALDGGAAAEFLVLTEDAWNDLMNDSIVVRSFRCLLHSAVDHVARASGGRIAGGALQAIRAGVRKFIDIDRREQRTTMGPPDDAREGWWPKQGEVWFADEIETGRKLYSPVTDNIWNSRPETTYSVTVRLTSKTKALRHRWEVPVGTGSYVVAGDLYLTSHKHFKREAPGEGYPSSLSAEVSAKLARRQAIAMQL